MHGPINTVITSGSLAFSILDTAHIGGNCGGDIIYQFREMFLYIVNKSGTAGGGHFLAFLEVFLPILPLQKLQSYRRPGYFHEIGKSRASS